MPERNLNIALVGNPNSGKTSLFNALTGMNQKVGNFPGVTVEKKSGKCVLDNGKTINIIDLPGTYSIYPKSADEFVTNDVLFDTDENVAIDLIVVIADASNLKRNLLFCSQIIDLKKPVIICLSMMDLAHKRGLHIDINGLQRDLGVPVVGINPRKKRGISELKSLLSNQLTVKPTIPVRDFIDNYELNPLAADIIKNNLGIKSNYQALQIAAGLDYMHFISGDQKEHIHTLLEEAGFNKTKLQAEETIRRYQKIKTLLLKNTIEENPLRKQLLSEKADRLLLHPLWGYIILLSVLFILFQSIFWISSYPSDFIDEKFTGLINQLNAQWNKTFLNDLIINGILAGINGIVVFIPQIMILFGLITLLEDSGYMARISFLSDRLMRSAGLSGRSVMPLMSGFACAVPAIMATRTIEDKKERLITILITPLMSCSARLPVYTILISLVIPSKTVFGFIHLQGLVMMGLYLLGVAIALLIAKLMNTFIRMKSKSIFLMELPVYRYPRWGNILTTMIQKARVFVLDAGKIILIISVILWALSSYGIRHLPENGKTDYFAPTDLKNSYAGSIGKGIEPIIKPLGYDWKIGIALITSFAAREVFVGTMSTLYSADENSETSLKRKMAAAKWPDGGEIYTPATGISLLLFYAFAMQCMSTLAIVKRETKSWKIPVIQFLYMGGLAYLSAWLAYTLFS